MKLFTFFSGLAIIIACIGLLGLSAFMINQRIKEIGVRKVLGASSFQIVWLLSTDFGKLILISTLFAIPAAYFWISSWLENFAYSIDLPWIAFVVAIVLGLAIGLLTIGIQAMKAAGLNPVESLRDE